MRTQFVVHLFASVAALAASQSASAQPAQPAQPTAVAVADDYVIGPQDVLGVIVWREAELSGDVTVRPDGRITLPVIGELAAAGLHPSELQQQIVGAAKKYLPDPNVTVVVRTINSRRVFVTGRVATPGFYMLVGPLTVMQALALSGGLMEYADGKNITILRTQDGETEVLKFNYRDVVKGKNLRQNVQLKPGDTVVVP